MYVHQHVCHVIDFGLAKRYQDPRNGRHIPYIEVLTYLHIYRRYPPRFRMLSSSFFFFQPLLVVNSILLYDCFYYPCLSVRVSMVLIVCVSFSICICLSVGPCVPFCIFLSVTVPQGYINRQRSTHGQTDRQTDS